MNGAGILSVGRVYCDLNFSGLPAMPQLGQETFAEELTLHGGGGALITSGYIAALGATSELLTRLPASPFGDLVQAEASCNGVGLSECDYSNSHSPQITVAMSHAKDRAFLTRRVDQALPDTLPAAFARLLSRVSLAHLHVGELATLCEYPQLIELARQHDMRISVDCSWDEAMFTDPRLPELISRIDVFLPNAEEMAVLKTNGVDEYVAPLTVIKRGAQGAIAHMTSNGLAKSIESTIEPLQVVDTIGAGDAFNAGFLIAWLNGQELQSALRLGNVCGAVAVSRRGGATNLPDLSHLCSPIIRAC